MKSMTGYSKVTEVKEDLEISVEVKTLNSKYLSVSFSTPYYLSGCEIKMNELVGKYVRRGKVSVRIYVKFLEPPEVVVDFATAQAYYSALEDLAFRLGIPEPIGVDDLLRFKEIIRFDLDDGQVEKVCNLVSDVLEKALVEVSREREIEGEKLKVVLERFLKDIEENVLEISRSSDNLIEQYAEALRGNVEKILPEDAIIDKNVLETAVAVLAERVDIKEEIDRLKSHIDRARDLLNKKGSIGPSLDFLAQEMLREFNTILSKAKMVGIVDHALSGKVLVNSFREQVQNVE